MSYGSCRLAFIKLLLCECLLQVNNTDAEGRLTLADALVYACNQGVDKVGNERSSEFFFVHMLLSWLFIVLNLNSSI